MQVLERSQDGRMAYTAEAASCLKSRWEVGWLVDKPGAFPPLCFPATHLADGMYQLLRGQQQERGQLALQAAGALQVQALLQVGVGVSAGKRRGQRTREGVRAQRVTTSGQQEGARIPRRCR